ncbi:MAG: protein phosphatase 2C domain-containing protein [Verrucomicrobia bacterium]|nr:protein phosphatase 2C domain-containing protein [Verrucomicrobiota bacterium]
MKELKDGIRSSVHIDLVGNVHKRFRGTDADKRCANEVRILQTLEKRDCPYVPRLLESTPDENYIVTTNCGAPAPNITRNKSDALFAELEREYGVRHDDPEPRNVTYNQKLGRFCLIDFELATLLPDPTHQAGESADVWRVSWSARTRQGSNHLANDDAFLALEVLPDGAQVLDPCGESLLEPAHLVLAVSDGMGGGKAGEFASRLVLSWIRKHAKTLYESLHDRSDDLTPLGDLLRNAHEGINKLAAGADNLTGMGATLTLAWITPHLVHLAHIGDTRLYLHRQGETTQLSHDHNIAWRQLKRGELHETEYRTHPRRSALYDALGGGHPSINPELSSHPLEDGDRLFLCTDGIIDGLWERHIRNDLSAQGSPRDVADQLLNHATANDTRDDATLIVADVRRL